MKHLLLTVLVAVGACAPPADNDAPERATLAIMTELRAGMPLDDMLRLLDEHLVRAMAGRMEGSSVDDFRRAEAISDRLLEARPPFEWIASEQYSLESRLRQIQSALDRVLAQLQTGAPRDTMLRDLRVLRTDVVRLRQTLAAGGTRAPPSIHQLLRGDTARPPPVRGGATPDPPVPSGPRPLGTPVGPPGGE
jgi:hypothetical protein